MDEIINLDDLITTQLTNMFKGEKKLAISLVKMNEKVTVEDNNDQVLRIKQAFNML